MLYFLVRIGVNALTLLLVIMIVPGLGINPVVAEQPLVVVLGFIFLGAIFAFLNWLLWPILLLLSGQLVLWTYGLVLFLLNAFIFFLATFDDFDLHGDAEGQFLIAAEPFWLRIIIAGAVMTLYLSASGIDKRRFVGTNAWFFLIVNATKVPFSVGLGLMHWSDAGRALALAPAVLLGGLLGYATIKRISQARFDVAVLAASAVAAAALLVR